MMNAFHATKPAAFEPATNAVLGAGAYAPSCRDQLKRDIFRQSQIGQISVEFRGYTREHEQALSPSKMTSFVIVPVAGTIEVAGDDDHARLVPGSALLLARCGPARCAWAAGSSGLVLGVPTTLLQQAVISAFPQPRRLAPINHLFELEGSEEGLGGILASLMYMIECGAQISLVGSDRCLADALVVALRSGKHDTLFPVSSSLQRASDYLLAHPDSNITNSELASIAGVTLRTLRLNAKTCLGVPLARFVEQMKLTWVRDRLINPMESRSIAQLAEAIGYRNPSSLARSYQRQFGETPTQARSRAFASMTQ